MNSSTAERWSWFRGETRSLRALRQTRRALYLDVLEAIAAGQRARDVAAVLCRWIGVAAPRAGCAVLAVNPAEWLHVLAASGVPDATLTRIEGSPLPPGTAPWLPLPGDPACWLHLVAGDEGHTAAVFALHLDQPREPSARERRVVRRCIHLLALVLRHEAVLLEFEQSSARLDAALTNVRQGLCFFDRSRRLVVANGRYSEIYGIAPGVIQPGMLLSDIVDLRLAVGSGPSMSPERYLNWRNTVQGDRDPNDTIVELANGRVVAVHHRPMPDGGWVATHEDITERRAAEAHIHYLASHDTLTGLANRLLFRTRLEAAMDQPNMPGFAVLFLDLDRFKAVNDTYGHPVGDQLLIEVAQRLRASVRDADTITRLGGDEFAILLMSVAERDRVQELAQRLLSVLTAPYEIAGHRLRVGASLGAALAPLDGATPEALLKHADLALYHAKTAKRGSLRFYDTGMNLQLDTRLRRETELRSALRAGQFELEYQPLICLATRTVAGFEALLRWRHPIDGLVLPGTFITLAEETGLIVPIGAWVLEEACRTAATWPDSVAVAVNVSALQFRNGGILATIDGALARSGLDPIRLELEITESVLLHDSALVLDVIERIRRRGVRLSLDDFGTGQSSLSHVQSFPFDKIKIDRSFVQAMALRRESRAVVRAIAGLGHSLDVPTTAEGVETPEQLALVQAEGCTEAQGYFFARPMAAAAVRTFLMAAQPAPTTAG